MSSDKEKVKAKAFPFIAEFKLILTIGCLRSFTSKTKKYYSLEDLNKKSTSVMFVIYSIIEMLIKEWDNWSLMDEMPPTNRG